MAAFLLRRLIYMPGVIGALGAPLVWSLRRVDAIIFALDMMPPAFRPEIDCSKSSTRSARTLKKPFIAAISARRLGRFRGARRGVDWCAPDDTLDRRLTWARVWYAAFGFLSCHDFSHSRWIIEGMRRLFIYRWHWRILSDCFSIGCLSHTRYSFELSSS